MHKSNLIFQVVLQEGLYCSSNWRCEHARFCVEGFYALYINFHSFIHSFNFGGKQAMKLFECMPKSHLMTASPSMLVAWSWKRSFCKNKWKQKSYIPSNNKKRAALILPRFVQGRVFACLFLCFLLKNSHTSKIWGLFSRLSSKLLHGTYNLNTQVSS